MKNRVIRMVAGVSFALLGTALTGCEFLFPDQGKPQEKPPMPEVYYTTDESLIGTDANADTFALKNIEKEADHPLAGKTIYWLGSSVTYGASSGGVSMADYLAATTGCISKKEAVSGTTIFTDGKSANTGAKSYTSRLKTSSVFDKSEEVDAFVCQISTNDAWGTRIENLGTMSESTELDSTQFDLTTTIGGVEFIINYVIETWGCPVYFYSGAYFADEGVRSSTNPKGSDYATLVRAVQEVCDKWNEADGNDCEVAVIDLFNDEEFNAAVSDEYYSWATSDAVHPKKVGYLQWWTPYFDAYLTYHLTMR